MAYLTPEQRLVMRLLLDTHPTLLADDEIARELDLDEPLVERTLKRLVGAGLAHELDGFHWATHTATTAVAIDAE